MAESNLNLLKRVVSAIAGVGILVAMAYTFGTKGLHLACLIAIVVAVNEYAGIAFRAFHPHAALPSAFKGAAISLYLLASLLPGQEALWLALTSCGFFLATIWLTRNHTENHDLLATLAVGVLGQLLCVLFPLFADKLSQGQTGTVWFSFLLLVVFCGDTAAYFGGRLLGRRKFMPKISPNKTWEGSIAGLMGSCLAGTVLLAIFIPEIPVYRTAVFCLLCGFAAQTGDLLMSLVKRVAQVKDSGGIMPGHGGILDRIDGVLIASPLVYAFSLYAAM